MKHEILSNKYSVFRFVFFSYAESTMTHIDWDRKIYYSLRVVNFILFELQHILIKVSKSYHMQKNILNIRVLHSWKMSLTQNKISSNLTLSPNNWANQKIRILTRLNLIDNRMQCSIRSSLIQSVLTPGYKTNILISILVKKILNQIKLNIRFKCLVGSKIILQIIV